MRKTTNTTNELFYLLGDHPSLSLRTSLGLDQRQLQVRRLADGDAALGCSLAAKPWGEKRYPSGSSPLPTRLRFTGQRQDSYTGLTYLRARYYAPTTGRFTSRDTWAGDAKAPMSYNAWLYTYANPINFTDPTGMKACKKSNDPDCQFRAQLLHDYADAIKGLVAKGNVPPVEGFAQIRCDGFFVNLSISRERRRSRSVGR
jgi:RHS repeat-associated protein